MGEVGGAKIAGALELAAEDNRQGITTCAVLLLETGGVRLQEANLGLAAIAEIQAAIVELRQYQPVIGLVGCFGGMSIAAGLCSRLIVTREARLGLNGPQVIEQEAGIEEYDPRDRPFIWSLTGGEQRSASGLVDAYVADDVDAIRETLHRHLGLEAGLLEHPRAVAVGGETLGQGDESGVGEVRQVHFVLVGERRVGGDGEEDVVGKQRQLLAIRVVHAVIQGDQDGVQFMFFRR